RQGFRPSSARRPYRLLHRPRRPAADRPARGRGLRGGRHLSLARGLRRLLLRDGQAPGPARRRARLSRRDLRGDVGAGRAAGGGRGVPVELRAPRFRAGRSRGGRGCDGGVAARLEAALGPRSRRDARRRQQPGARLPRRRRRAVLRRARRGRPPLGCGRARVHRLPRLVGAAHPGPRAGAGRRGHRRGGRPRIQRRQGKWTESTANLERAAALDPKNTTVLINLCFSYVALRNFETADKVIDRGITASPDSFQPRALKGFMKVLWKGDLSAAKEVFSSVPPERDPNGLMTWAQAWMLTLERKYPDALQTLERYRGETMFTTTTAPAPKVFVEGMIYLLQGDKTRAQAEFEHARVISEKLLREAPEDPARHAQHGLILARLG